LAIKIYITDKVLSLEWCYNVVPEKKPVTCNLLNHPIYVISFDISVLWLQWFNDRGMILGIPYNIYIDHFTYDNQNCTCTWPSLIYLCF
jgi:hypothetical protein